MKEIENRSEQPTVALYAKSYVVEPAEGNGQQELPLPLLAKRILEVATLHAESWGVGYSTLIKNRQVWVLSRLAIEMSRYPRINEHYTLETWIVGYNKHFSARNFPLSDEGGNPCG